MKKEVQKSEFDKLFDKLNLWASNREKRKFLNTYKKYLLSNFNVKNNEYTLIEKEEELDLKINELVNIRKKLPSNIKNIFLEKIEEENREMEKFTSHKIPIEDSEKLIKMEKFQNIENTDFQKIICDFHRLKNILHKKSEQKNYFSFFKK